jgi:tripartite-type tricarboxylate transporter receptor subunit TctC
MRTLADEAKKSLGVEVLVVNKPGAHHTVAMSYVISRPADGYTLGTSTDAPFTRGSLIMKLTFDPNADTIPIIAYGTFPNAIIVREDSPFKNFQDAINFAKENPSKLTYGHIGQGSAHYINMAALALQRGLKIAMVPFGGDSEIVISLLGGHIMMTGIGISSCANQIKAGKIRLLAMDEGDEVRKKYPGVPTFYDVGFKDICPPPILVIWGPKGLPDPVVKKLEGAFIKASQSDQFRTFALNNEVYPINKANTGQELKYSLIRGFKTWGNLIQRLGVADTKPK